MQLESERTLAKMEVFMESVKSQLNMLWKGKNEFDTFRDTQPLVLGSLKKDIGALKKDVSTLKTDIKTIRNIFIIFVLFLCATNPEARDFIKLLIKII